VHAAKRTGSGTPGRIDLGDIHRQVSPSKFIVTENARKKASVVTFYVQIYET
jgi:hypothetical protein